MLAENLKQRAHKEAKIVNDAKALGEALKAIEIKITAKAGGEKLFGSISNIENVYYYSLSKPLAPMISLNVSVKLNNYQKVMQREEQMDDF